jgi:hypothetical protein
MCQRWLPMTVLLSCFAIGCNSQAHSKTEVERGKAALTSVLESWKNAEPPEKLKSLAEPVEFADELRGTNQLVEYTIGTADAKDPQTIRYRVTMKLKDRKGVTKDREAVFMVSLKTPIVIARDPYN